MPDGSVIVGRFSELGMDRIGELGNTSEVGITRVVVGLGAVGPVAGSVTPVVGEGRIGTTEVTSETTDDTTDVASDTTDDTAEVASDTTEETTEEASETTEDTKDVTPGMSPVGLVSEVGITPGTSAVVGTDAAVVGAVGSALVPKAVVIPTTIPLEVSGARGVSGSKPPDPEGNTEGTTDGRIDNGSEGRSPLEGAISEGCTMVVGRPPVDPGTMNGPSNCVESPVVVASPAVVVVGLGETADAGASPLGAVPDVDTMKGGMIPPEEAALSPVVVVSAGGTIVSGRPIDGRVGNCATVDGSVSTVVVGCTGDSGRPSDVPTASLDGVSGDAGSGSGDVDVVTVVNVGSRIVLPVPVAGESEIGTGLGLCGSSSVVVPATLEGDAGGNKDEKSHEGSDSDCR